MDIRQSRPGFQHIPDRKSGFQAYVKQAWPGFEANFLKTFDAFPRGLDAAPRETRCVKCETVTSRDEAFLDLSLEIEVPSSSYPSIPGDK